MKIPSVKVNYHNGLGFLFGILFALVMYFILGIRLEMQVLLGGYIIFCVLFRIFYGPIFIIDFKNDKK